MIAQIFIIVGLITGMASVAGLIYAVLLARKNRKIKLLAYDVTGIVPLARAVSPEKEYKLFVTYEQRGQPQEKLDSVYVRFLRFANFGKESIRRDDIAPVNPIQISIEGTRTLDIALSGITRPVNNVDLINQTLSKDSASANITFDYLDHEDGAVLKILTVGGGGTARLTGDIIGAPEGIKRVDEISSRSGRVLNKAGKFIAVIFFISAFSLSFFAFYWVTGAWTNVWLLVLPFLALIIPTVILFATMILWDEMQPSIPHTLALPKWFGALHYPYAREFMISELIARDYGDIPIDTTEE